VSSYRPVWFRALIGIWSLWFGAMLSEPGALHTCPTHGGGSHAAHAAHMPGMEHGSGGQHAPASKTHCTCLGDCCSSSPAAPPAVRVAVDPAARVVRVTPSIVASADAAPAEAPPHRLPFANGPPAAGLPLG